MRAGDLLHEGLAQAGLVLHREEATPLGVPSGVGGWAKQKDATQTGRTVKVVLGWEQTNAGW